MPSQDRELVRHQGTSTESGRLSVPMWDSSDPERCPPPLPLNPRSMSPATKSNVSPNIQAVAAKFTDKPSENAPSSYTTNHMPKSSSPERQLVKGHYHKRMQSMPPDTKGDARSEFLNYLENRSPERPLRATSVDPTNKQQDKNDSAGSPTSRPVERELPSYISNRYLSKPILGENTPTSATMLALQNMQLPAENDPPSPSKAPKMITASADPVDTQRDAPTMSSLETQILSLTEIASSLKREMSNLSRRSKDNATDLVSLKAATNARDEDIRKSLKELSSSLTSKLLDNDGLSSPNSKRSYSVPRMPSPNPFSGYDREFCGSPGPISDGSASIALLEKVLREMATKEGEERLLELVDEIKTRPASSVSDKDADEKILNMLEEILNTVKEDPSSRALVRSMQAINSSAPNEAGGEGTRSLSAGSFDPSATVRALNLSKSDGETPAAPGEEDMMAILRSVKSSVIEGGGMTNGVKSLVRELRGEVLGMGRDLARKLETVESTRAIDDQEKPQPPSAEQISDIVHESLQSLQEQLAATVEESRQHSSALSDFQSTMSLASIYSVVKKALDELELPQPQHEDRGPTMEKEDILETVREAWETYKPEIELQNFGLERDEILDCLSEGLKDYRPQHEQSITYDQVLDAVQTGMQNFSPPPIEQPPSITRDEIILTIRECLEKPEPASRGLDEDHANHLTSMKDEILGAVAMHAAEKPTARGFDEEHFNHFNAIKDEILHAVAMHAPERPDSRGLDEEHVNLFHSIKDEILNAVAMQAVEKPASRGLDEGHADHLNNIRDEILHALSQHAAEKPTRSLNEDHMEHLDSLRDEILNAVTGSMATQSMISKESFDSGLGRDEIVSAVSDGLEAHFTAAKDMEEPRVSRGDVIAAVNDAFDSQQAALSTAVQPSISREDIISAVADGIELSRKDQDTAVANIQPSVSREEILEAISEGLQTSSKDQESAVANISSSLSREEILEAIAEGLHNSSEADKSALSTSVGPQITREDVFQAVVEGMENANTMTREIELNKDDLMEAITAGLHEVNSSANANAGEQVMDRLQDVVDGMKEEFKQYSAANGRDTEQVLDAIKDGLEVLRKEIETHVVAAQDEAGKHEIIDTVKEGFRLLQADMEKTITDTSLSNESRGNPDTPELLDAMEKEFEHLRGTIVNMVVRDGTAGDKDEILDAIREISEHQKAHSGNDQVANSIREEFDNIRERMDSSLVRAEPTSDKEEIIAAVREHLDGIREEAFNRKDGGESMMSATSELLDAFNDGIDTIKDDLKKLLEKPAEFDTTEVLDTIKDGLADLKVDIDSLRQSQKEADDNVSTARGGELMLADQPNIGSEFEGLKTLINQLQDKVDSIDSTSREAEAVPNEDALKKAHVDEVLVAIQEVQVVIAEMSAARDAQEGQVRKEDIEGIENLIMSTKTQIEEMVVPTPDQIATPEHIGTLETMIREAKDTITELSSRMEAEAPTKSDMGTLEGLIKDVWIALDELKGKAKEGEEGEGEREIEENADSDKLLKSDLQTVEAMVFEVKSQIDELKIPDPETIPTKEEVQELQSLVTDFRDKMEANNDMTAQGFDARKTEHAGLAEKIDEAKLVVGELGDELKSKLDGSSEGLTELKQLLEGLALSAENFSTVESIKELTDLINREFERAHGEENAGKLDQEERDAAAMVKHDETRAAIIVELGAKIDEKVGEIMAKYEDAHNSLHSKFSETEERDLAHAEAVTSTKSLTEDIKLVIGAMGDNVNLTCERIGEDTKNLFGKVDESYNRMEEMHNELKSQQEQSHSENERAAAATERVESKLLEFNPQILETVQQILTVVSQHYDHSQKSADDFRTELSALPSNIPSMLPALPAPESSRDLEDDPVHDKLNDILEHAKNTKVYDVLNTLLEHSQNNQLHEKLDRALDQSAGPKDEIYSKLDQLLDHASNDNGSLHEKLDALLSRPEPTQSHADEHSVTQMMKLDEMHKDIMENTRRMNEMFAAQSALVAEDTERKRREAEEAAIALERRVSQREQVEAEIVGLHEEKDSLLKMIQTLQTEKDDLAKQNTKLSKEVSGLETALEIRHEEMQQMEDRADGLEKRILEGVLDHARTVLLSRSTGSQSMNLRRNRSTRTSRTGARSPSMTSVASTARESKDPRSLLGNGIGMALKRGLSTNSGATPVQPNIGKERRIFSLSHVTGNRGMDRQASGNGGLTNLKRSHSVKSNFSLRKSSWAGRMSVDNKENEAFREEDEPGSEPESDAGTERRTSYAGTDRKSSYAGTVTDSVVTGTESIASTDRRTSGMSTATDGHTEVPESSVGGEDHADDQSIYEDPDQSDRAPESGAESDDAETARGDDDQEEDHANEELNDDELQDLVDRDISDTASQMEAQVLKLLEPPTDSGLGTETTVST